jgi:archaemetzincin
MLKLLPIGRVDALVLSQLRDGLEQQFRMYCEILPESMDAHFAYHAERQQYHSSEILAWMRQQVATGNCWRLLGVTAADLYIPILTFVFGEAQLEGRCALVSTHRLQQDFYGLPQDDGLLCERLLKEAIHELGHTLGLTHCDDYSCVMAASHAVEWIDLKQTTLCPHCEARLSGSSVQSPAPAANE